MRMKKLMGSLIAIVMAVGMVGGASVNAKVIEPEVVRTETWTTSYFIDDDTSALYPYIQCEADIYNDGTIEVYAWNTHEWDGFATVEHTATFIEATPVKYSTYVKGKSEKYNYNFYPDEYDMNSHYSYRYTNEYIETDSWFDEAVYIPQYRGALPEMSFSEKRKTGWKNFGTDLTFSPKIEPTDTYNFKIYGHDITITPDLLQSTAIPEAPVNEVDALKAEIESLKTQIAQLSNTLASQKNRAYGDMNDDGYVDARDASLLLTLYARQSVGDPITLDQLVEEQKGQ